MRTLWRLFPTSDWFPIHRPSSKSVLTVAWITEPAKDPRHFLMKCMSHHCHYHHHQSNFYCFACFCQGGISLICTGLELYSHFETNSVTLLCAMSLLSTTESLFYLGKVFPETLLPREIDSVALIGALRLRDFLRRALPSVLSINKKIDMKFWKNFIAGAGDRTQVAGLQGQCAHHYTILT